MLFDVSLNNDMVGQPAITDLNGDGMPDIVLATRDSILYVFDFYGRSLNEHFPLKLKRIPQTGPLCQDVDNDGTPEILFETGDGFLHLFHADGTEFKNFPVELGNGFSALPVIDDIDLDGDADIVIGEGNQLTVLDLNSTMGPSLGWNTYQGNNSRTGTYGVVLSGIERVNVPVVPHKLTLYANYPNPFNMETVIRFYIPKNEQGQKAELTIYNVLGQKIRSYPIRAAEAGEQRVVWNGTNQAGQVVTSGIYFYKLSVGKHARIRRMLLIK